MKLMRVILLWSVLSIVSGQAADVNITVDADEQEGWVPYTMFGANFVMVKNDFNAAWKGVFEDCGMAVIRYPGGTVTEKGLGSVPPFDFTTNAPYMLDILLYCKTNTSIRPIFVVPTFRFTNDLAGAAVYASNFVTYVNTTLRNQYGTPRVTRWEIGNEYYQDLTPLQYAQIADVQAAAILQADPNVTPIVHYKRDYYNETQTIANYLDSSANAGCVKSCNTHVYPGSSENIATTIPDQLLYSSDVLGFSLPEYVTEWNVAGSDTNDYMSGMSLANRQMSIFKSLVWAGVDYATIWPMVWNPNYVDSALARYDGTMRPQGQAYQWLQQSAKGTWLVEGTDDSSVLDVQAFKYLQTERLSILISGFSLPSNSSICLTVNNFSFDPDNGVSAQRMYAPTGDEYANTTASISGVSPSVWGSLTNKLTFSINKNCQCEIVKIDLTPAQ